MLKHAIYETRAERPREDKILRQGAKRIFLVRFPPLHHLVAKLFVWPHVHEGDELVRGLWTLLSVAVSDHAEGAVVLETVVEAAHARGLAHIDKARPGVGGKDHVANGVVQRGVFGGVRGEDLGSAHDVSLALADLVGGFAALRTVAVSVCATTVPALEMVHTPNARRSFGLSVPCLLQRFAARSAIACRRSYVARARHVSRLFLNERAALRLVELDIVTNFSVLELAEHVADIDECEQ
eukprot:6183587-Pleurochrysis_carterae.AAC.1